jgi:Domain of unknown function DUF29
MTAQKRYVPPMPSNQSLYERDFYAWTNEQAALLRAGKLDHLDIENVAEEIESMGRGEKNELTNRLTVLLLHLLKWKYQPAFQGKSWERSIREQRRRSLKHLGENPSLKSSLPVIFDDAYADALGKAEDETGLDRSTFPDSLPWTREQVFSGDWLPE